MKLEPHSRLGPYEILSPAGAGGMGEVWKAKDTRLDRTVAIKVLPEELSFDPERRRRLEQEARAVASLAHPHICTLFDIGRENGIDYLVLEYLEGETLAERLRRGALPLEEAVRYGRQMAEALHQAHLKGVVHRDVKPGNVMLTKGGVKLLDFGLARLRPVFGSAIAAGDSGSPTKNEQLTREGAIVGTLHYMAPEQLEGKESDGRADVFSLGCVVYEMVTGRRAFEGESPASVVASILSKTPTRMSELTPLTPPSLERVVRECLAKDPDARWQSAADLGSEIRWISEESVPSTPRRSRRTWALLAGAIVLAAIAGWGNARWIGSSPRSAAGPVRLSIALPPGHELATDSFGSVAVSPDGSRVVYSARDEQGVLRLYLRPLESFESTPLPGTEDGGSPFFSPDSAWVGFHAKGRLYKIPVSGGAPVVVTAAPAGFYGASWGEDGTIVFDTGSAGRGLMEIPASGGEAVPVSLPDGNRRAVQWSPQILPGGEAILCLDFTRSWEEPSIAAFSRRDRDWKPVYTTGAVNGSARYVGSGHLMFSAPEALMAARFDPDSLSVLGPPARVMEGVLGTDFRHHFDLTNGGTLVFIPGNAGEDINRPVWGRSKRKRYPSPCRRGRLRGTGALPRRPVPGPRRQPGSPNLGLRSRAGWTDHPHLGAEFTSSLVTRRKRGPLRFPGRAATSRKESLPVRGITPRRRTSVYLVADHLVPRGSGRVLRTAPGNRSGCLGSFVVDVENRPSFTASPPRVLFEGRFEVTTGHNQNYDVAPDGRFLMIQRLDSARLTEIRVVVGFDRELERLVPVP